jgi:hypothetical protein
MAEQRSIPLFFDAAALALSPAEGADAGNDLGHCMDDLG